MEYKEFEDEELEDVLENAENPQDLNMWRKCMFSLLYKEKELRDIEDLKKSVVSKYDENIKKRKEKIENFKAFLKASLITGGNKTKTGGFNIDIPDLGKLSASKESLKVSFAEDFKTDKRFLVKKEVFSKEVLNERLQLLPIAVIDTFENTVQLEYDVKEGDTIVNKNTGEVVQAKTLKIENDVLYDTKTLAVESKSSYKIKISRKYSFPKLEKGEKKNV